MGGAASLYGLLGLIFLAFGFVGTALVGLGDAYSLLNLVGGVLLLVLYLVFGLENFRTLVGQRSTRYGAGAAVYSLLFVVLIARGNYLGPRRPHPSATTGAGIHTLSPHTKHSVEKACESPSCRALA